MKKKYKDLETGEWFTVDDNNTIIHYTPEECKDKKLREKKWEKLEKQFSDIEEEGGDEDDNKEETT